jgi:uncharacterized membrane protein
LRLRIRCFYRASTFQRPEDNAMKGYVTVGLSMLAGAALLEVALVPGLVIGGAAVLLAPQLPSLRRHLRPLFNSTVSQRRASTVRARRKRAAPLPARFGDKAPLDPARFGIKQAIAKTITFRIIVTTLDFTTNYVVIGELATAAGLSAFALVAGPVFYLAHETAWNYFGPSGADVGVPIRLPIRLPLTGEEEVSISRALTKTITFRTIATAIDFTTNYVVVGDLATAAGLSAFAFVVGPFVYLGHEKLWDRYGSPNERTPDPAPPTKLLPAPA